MHGQISKVVPANTIGTVMGTVSSVDTLARVLSPLIGGVVMSWYGPEGVGALAFLCLLPIIAYQGWTRMNRRKSSITTSDKKEL